jgi:phage terminase small subunit
MADLTPKQQRFVTEYLATGNASEAYRRAYNCKTRRENTINVEACKLLKHPKIAQRVGVVQAEATKKAIAAHELTREWVLENLMLNARMALGQADIPFSVTEDGKTTSKTFRKIDPAAANKALELLGKVDGLGLFVDRSSVDVRQEFAQMDDNELDQFIHERLN